MYTRTILAAAVCLVAATAISAGAENRSSAEEAAARPTNRSRGVG